MGNLRVQLSIRDLLALAAFVAVGVVAVRTRSIYGNLGWPLLGCILYIRRARKRRSAAILVSNTLAVFSFLHLGMHGAQIATHTFEVDVGLVSICLSMVGVVFLAYFQMSFEDPPAL